MINQKTTPQKNLLKQYWFAIFLLTAFVLLTLSTIFKMITPQPTIVQENSWNEITPGHSTAQDLVEYLGEPISSSESKYGTILEYKSLFPSAPNQVVVDQTGTVTFIKEFLDYDENHTLSKYADIYGDPDLILNDLEGRMSLKTYVFLDEGLVIKAHELDNTVQEKWYFEPTDQNSFLNSWGENLSNQNWGPE